MLVRRWVVLALTLTVAGCVAAAPVSPPAPAAGTPAPPAYAMRAGDVPLVARWQQFCEQATNVTEASWLAASRGGDGWELVSMYGGVLCFKRPVPAAGPTLPPPPQEMLGSRTYTPSLPATGTVPSIIDPGF